jgi:hypothetical protein
MQQMRKLKRSATIAPAERQPNAPLLPNKTLLTPSRAVTPSCTTWDRTAAKRQHFAPALPTLYRLLSIVLMPIRVLVRFADYHAVTWR